MQTVKLPYEFLARWDVQGVLAGAHVQYRYVIRDGEHIVADSVGPAEPVPPTIDGAFPLAAVVGNDQHQFLAALAARDATILEQASTIGALEAEVFAREADVAARDDEIIRLNSEHQAVIRQLLEEHQAEISRVNAPVGAEASS